MYFTTVIMQLVSLMLIAAVGTLLTKLGIIDETVAKGAGNILTKACLPCLLITNMQLDFTAAVLGDMAVSAGGFMLVMLISAALVLPVILVRKSGLSESGVLIICASFPNVVYVGRPLIEALYSDAANVPITAVTLIFNLTVFSAGVALVTMGGEKRGGAKTLLKNSVFNPAVIAGLLGILFFLFSVKIPEPVLAPMKMMSGMITPLSMIIIGYSLTKTKLADIVGDFRVFAVSAVRLILAPAAVFFLLSPLIKNPVILGTLTVGAALPTGANAGVIAQLYGNRPDFAAKCIFVSTLLSVITAPVMIYLLLGG